MNQTVGAHLDKSLLQSVAEIARLAGEKIMEVYNRSGDVNVSIKGDNSPVTEADLLANKIIHDGLKGLMPAVPVLSEESEIPSYEERSKWARYWLVDPLDGTKEFIRRNGEFTVNIALIDDGVPVLGVVYVPVKAVVYGGVQGKGAFKYVKGVEQVIHVSDMAEKLRRSQPVIVVASRRHGVKALEKLLARIRNAFDQVETCGMGSSLKLCLVAEGAADFYPRMAPTCEWDTAAAQAVVEAAGGRVLDDTLRDLRYNTKSDLLNPYFYVIGDPAFNWSKLLA